jgi:hypothetical protein
VRFFLGDFDVDDFGITRTQAAQFMAYGAGIARIIEPLLPLVVGRPPRIPAGIPAGDRFIGSRSKPERAQPAATAVVLYLSASIRRNSRVIPLIWARYVATS